MSEKVSAQATTTGLVQIYAGRDDLTPGQRALINSPLFQHVVCQTIADIQAYLSDNDIYWSEDFRPERFNPDDYDIDPPRWEWSDLLHNWHHLKTFARFAYFCVMDGFAHNPYNLPSWIYIALFSSLFATIVVKWIICFLRLRADLHHRVDGTPKDPEDKEIGAVFNEIVGILPILVQFVLFVFPPLLANAAA